MEEQGLQKLKKATYDPNAKKWICKRVLLHQLLGNILLMAKEADVIADAQNRWTEIKHENVDTKAKKDYHEFCI